MSEINSTPLVRLSHVSKSFGPVQVLKDVTLEMYRGEVLCLAGENGAGKSTLIKILTGAIPRDSGEYRIDGQDVGSPSPAQARELGVGVVYQELSLLPEVSVEENLLMGRLPGRGGVVNKRELRGRAIKMLERVGLNRVDPGTLVSDLPVATRQMVEIAKVLGADARIVIFDEPTTSLSEEDARSLLQLINRLKKEENVAVLYVTHRLEEIFEIGDRKPLRPGSPAQAVKAGLGLLTEDRKEMGILKDLSIRENVTLADLSAVSRLEVILRRLEVSLVTSLVPRLRLKYHSTEQPISSLSGGN